MPAGSAIHVDIIMIYHIAAIITLTLATELATRLEWHWMETTDGGKSDDGMARNAGCPNRKSTGTPKIDGSNDSRVNASFYRPEERQAGGGRGRHVGPGAGGARGARGQLRLRTCACGLRRRFGSEQQ